MSLVLFKQLGVSFVLAIVLALVATPLLLMGYRRTVGQGMRARAGRAAAAERSGSATAPQAATRAVDTDLWLAARRVIRQRGLAYGFGGAAQALLLGSLYLSQQPAARFPAGVLSALAVFLVPTVVAVVLVVLASGWTRLLLIPAVLLLTLVLSGAAAGLLVEMFSLHLLVPAAVLLIFSVRFWRGAAPLVFLLALAACNGWVLLASVAQHGLGIGPGAGMVPFRVLGFSLGLAAGWKLLEVVASRYDRGGVSDQELFLDIWFLIYTLTQAVVFSVTSGRLAVGGLVLLSYGLYWAVKRLRLATIPAPPSEPRRLMLLRVFGFDRRSERLFDQLRQHWSPIGSIELIAGTDLALQQVSPGDFLAFLGGRLRQRFLSAPPEQPTPSPHTSHPVEVAASNEARRRLADGSHPVRQYLCFADTWQAVMQAVSRQSDVVVMDLRGFGPARQGCRIELEALADDFHGDAVVLVRDASTDGALLHSLLEGRLAPMHDGRRGSTLWCSVEAGRSDQHTLRDVFRAMTPARMGPAATPPG
jgi:hypothetical protein